MPHKETLAEGVELYLGDCRSILPSLGKVDAVVTDPPFIGLAGGVNYKLSGVTQTIQNTITVGDPWNASTDWMLPAWELCRDWKENEDGSYQVFYAGQWRRIDKSRVVRHCVADTPNDDFLHRI